MQSVGGKSKRRHVVRDEAKAEAALRTGRRKGAQSVREIIEAAISGFSAELLGVLNHVYPWILELESELSEQAVEISWASLRDAIESLARSSVGNDKYS